MLQANGSSQPGAVLADLNPRPTYAVGMDPQEEALAGASKALREAAFAFERHMLEVDADALPPRASKSVCRAIDGLSRALAIVEANRS